MCQTPVSAGSHLLSPIAAPERRGLTEDKLSEWPHRLLELFWEGFVNVKNGASTSLRVGMTEQVLWAARHEVPGLQAGDCWGGAGRVQGLASTLTLFYSETLFLQSGLTVFSRLSVCRDLPNRFFRSIVLPNSS